MTFILSSKKLKEIQEENSIILEKFMYGLSGMYLPMIKESLADNGIFCGKNKRRFLTDLYILFDKYKYRECSPEFNKGLCLDKLPGAEVIEIRILFGNVTDSEFRQPIYPLGTLPKDSELVFRYSVTFESNLINRIEVPERFVEETKKEHLEICN